MEEKDLLLENLFQTINCFKEGAVTQLHPYDISIQLQKLRELDYDQYKHVIQKLPHNLFAEILSEMPAFIQV